MTTLLPLLALALVVLAFVVSPPTDRENSSGPWPASLGLTALLLFLALAVPAWLYKADHPWVLASAMGAGVGFAGSLAADFAQRLGRISSVVALGLAVAVVGGAHWASPELVMPAQLGVLVGATIGAWCTLSGPDGFGLAPQFAIAAAAMVACDALGGKALPIPAGGFAGTSLGFVATVIALLLGLPEILRKPRPSSGILAVVAVVLMCAGGWIVGARYLDIRDAWLLFGGSAVSALVVNLMLPADRQEDAFRFLVAAVIWIAIGTVGFALRKGFGMAIAAVAVSSALILLRNPRVLLTAGPLFALVFYRVFREAFPEVSRALDIGQHYAFVGIAIGAILPLLPAEWLIGRFQSTPRWLFARALWALALVAVPVPLAILLSAKGLVGYVAGLGFAALVEGIKGSRSLLPMALVGGLASATTLIYGWTVSLLDLTREEKQGLLPWILGVAVVVAAVVAALSAGKRTVSE